MRKPLNDNYCIYLLQVSILEQLDSAHLISIQKCRAEITSPDHNDDVIHKFLSSLALSLPLNSTIHHLTDCSSIAIKVCTCMYMYVYVYVCMYGCMYMYVYNYVCKVCM